METETLKKIKAIKRVRKPKKIKAIMEEMIDMDPRQQGFASAYMDPGSLTYGNALQSALKAGFTQEYSESITYKKPRWLSEIVGKMNYMDSVNRNIKKHLDLKTATVKINKKTGEETVKEDAKLLKIQQDMTIFIAEKLMPEYKKKDKFEIPPGKVEIGQIIIMSPNGEKVDYNQSNTEAVRRLLGSTRE